MFNTIKNTLKYIFLGDLNAFDQTIYGARSAYAGENNMARIIKNTDGSGTLFVDGQEVRTYARARDAKRGAARLGYSVL